MKRSELQKLVAEKYGKGNDYSDFRVSIRPSHSKGVAIEVAQMYSFVDFDFEFMSQLSEIFKTKKINIGDRYSQEGCETCNHGSSYEVTLYIENLGIEMEWD